MNLNEIKAHVVCYNDSVEHVVIGSEHFAKGKMHQLRDADFYKRVACADPDVKNYNAIYYWHLHTVDWTASVKKGD